MVKAVRAVRVMAKAVRAAVLATVKADKSPARVTAIARKSRRNSGAGRDGFCIPVCGPGLASLVAAGFRFHRPAASGILAAPKRLSTHLRFL